MLKSISTSPGKDKEHYLVRLDVFELSLKSFLGKTIFLSDYHCCLYGSERLAMEGKSVVPMSILVSIYGHLTL